MSVLPNGLRKSSAETKKRSMWKHQDDDVVEWEGAERISRAPAIVEYEHQLVTLRRELCFKTDKGVDYCIRMSYAKEWWHVETNKRGMHIQFWSQSYKGIPAIEGTYDSTAKKLQTNELIWIYRRDRSNILALRNFFPTMPSVWGTGRTKRMKRAVNSYDVEGAQWMRRNTWPLTNGHCEWRTRNEWEWRTGTCAHRMTWTRITLSYWMMVGFRRDGK